jgi:hypothetical protein
MLGTCSQILRIKNKATQKMLSVKVLRPPQHYIPSGYKSISDEGYEGHTFVSIITKDEVFI